MSVSKNSFQLNLASDSAITLTDYTATFDDIDNIAVQTQDLQYTSIGPLKVVFGTVSVQFTQNNQALGHHTISLPDGFFTDVLAVNLTISESTAYQITAHANTVADDSVIVYYSQGQNPGSTTTTGTVNIWIVGV